MKKKTDSAPKSKAPKDPYAKREARRYKNPIPSREFILETFNAGDEPLSLETIAARLDIADIGDRDAIEKRISAMVRDNQLVREGEYYRPHSQAELIKGRVIGNKAGFGFVAPVDGNPANKDLYLPEKEMRKVFDGDIVLVKPGMPDFKGRVEASVVSVVEYGRKNLVGHYFEESGVAFVKPDNPRIQQDILVVSPPDKKHKTLKPETGQVVGIELLTRPDRHQIATGYISEILGHVMDPGMEIDIAVRNHDLPYLWPEDVTKQANELPEEVLETDKSLRHDLRKLPLVTIDGEDARDFDDAVFCERTRNGGFRLVVAIADVSHYVHLHTPLDREAHNRGTSVYFPGSVIPMLPEKLSNGLCSLKPAVDRLCMSCTIELSADGKVLKSRFDNALMHSQARLTYTLVGIYLDQTHAEHNKICDSLAEPVKRNLDNLHALYKVLRKARDLRGAIDFETVETRIVFSEDRKIEKIVPVVRNDAHKLIEECMLLANVCAARYLEQNKLPVLYRVHEKPKAEKLETLRSWLAEIRLDLGGGESPSPYDYQKLARQIEGRPDHHVIQTMILRSMNQAVYQPENVGHFGLHYPSYTHFTSPIRRYPDLLVHRAIKYLLRKNNQESSLYPYDLPAMVAEGEHCSMTERRADEASRDVEAWLKCEFLLDHVGESYQGVITAVTSFGLFVELNDIYIEGLVHISTLGEFFNYDQQKQRLIGDHSRTTYHLGDSVSVVITRVNIDERKIDFELVNLLGRPGKRVRKRKGDNPPAAEKTGKHHKQETFVSDKKPRGKASPTNKKSAKKGKRTALRRKSRSPR
ncbi:MAG: ribonuclease R [Pseudomonadales bacterium]|nr:ribonuclease R [Pseudomonadales bacterium]